MEYLNSKARLSMTGHMHFIALPLTLDEYSIPNTATDRRHVERKKNICQGYTTDLQLRTANKKKLDESCSYSFPLCTPTPYRH